MPGVYNRKQIDAALLRDALHEKTIVMGCGCFDVFHIGHLEYLQGARELGDFLVIGVNTDESYRKLRGYSPYFSEAQRLAVVESIRHVGMAFLFDEVNMCASIETFQPAIFAVGIDKADFPMEEREYCYANGVEFALIGTHKIASSSEVKRFFLESQ